MTKLISLRLAILLTFAGICYGGIRSFAAQQTPQEIRAQADKYWKEGSYSQAQASYSKLLVADPKASDRIEIELRIAISLIRSAEWDKAIEATSAFDKANKHTTEDAEMQLWVGRLYHLVPHVGYKVKDKVTRGYNVPASDGGVAPIQVDLAAEDNKKSYDGFVSSLKLTEVIRKSGHIDHRELAILHEIEVASDLISKLEETRYWSLPTDKSYDWSIDATKPFDEKWRLPKQVMYLYKLISTLDKSQPESDHHATVLAELGRACYILRLREPQRWYSPQYSEMQVSSRTGRGGFRPIPPRPI